MVILPPQNEKQSEHLSTCLTENYSEPMCNKKAFRKMIRTVRSNSRLLAGGGVMSARWVGTSALECLPGRCLPGGGGVWLTPGGGGVWLTPPL